MDSQSFCNHFQIRFFVFLYYQFRLTTLTHLNILPQVSNIFIIFSIFHWHLSSFCSVENMSLALLFTFAYFFSGVTCAYCLSAASTKRLPPLIHTHILKHDVWTPAWHTSSVLHNSSYCPYVIAFAFPIWLLLLISLFYAIFAIFHMDFLRWHNGKGVAAITHTQYALVVLVLWWMRTSVKVKEELTIECKSLHHRILADVHVCNFLSN